MKKGVLAGTFDPFTWGHYSVVEKSLELFSEIHILIADNPGKKCMFSKDLRQTICGLYFKDKPNVVIVSWEGLVVDYCKEIGAKYIIRGLRGSTDFGYENTMCHTNKMINPDIETMYFMTESKYIGVSSSAVRELVNNNYSYEKLERFVHPHVAKILAP
jgi:pantetheine-phosphate adenylyltransferase